MSEIKIKGMLLGAIAGDAVGTPFDGLSKAHIHAIFKSINKYTDASPALKNNLQNWKKAGLYSSATQLMLLFLIYLTRNTRSNFFDFAMFISKNLESAENEYGIFRHPDPMIRYFLKSVKGEIISHEEKEKKYYIPSARISVILIPFAVKSTKVSDNLIMDMFLFSSMFKIDAYSVSGALLFIILLISIINEKNPDAVKLINNAIETTNLLIEKTDVLSNSLSEQGIVPEQIDSSLKDYLNIFSQINDVKDISEAEKVIVNNVNIKMKTPVTRATIDHPLAIIPFAVFFTGCYLDQPSELLFRAAESGGSASVLCALTGALTGAMLGTDWLRGNLIDELINKKRIDKLIESALNAKITEALIDDFIQCEASLTAKEIQEKNAKLKHVKVKQKKTKKKPRKDIERELSAHVVESWTKLDKAKWRKKIGRDRE